MNNFPSFPSLPPLLSLSLTQDEDAFEQAIGALNKAQFVSFHLNPDIKVLFENAVTRLQVGDPDAVRSDPDALE